ncbi:MAG: hypothetical protein NVS4B12_02930 [Ktedonobacteraceae bacterium]
MIVLNRRTDYSCHNRYTPGNKRGNADICIYVYKNIVVTFLRYVNLLAVQMFCFLDDFAVTVFEGCF